MKIKKQNNKFQAGIKIGTNTTETPTTWKTHQCKIKNTSLKCLILC